MIGMIDPLRISDTDLKAWGTKASLLFLCLLNTLNYGLLAVEIDSVRFDRINYQVYQKVEMTFILGNSYQNAFDPDEVKVDVSILLPDSTTHLMPCFYVVPADYDPGSNDWIIQVEQGTWMLRYSPTIEGEYGLTIIVKDSAGQSESDALTFSVAAGEQGNGFIDQDPLNPQYYRFSNGEPYFPVGYNVPWGSGQPDRIGTFQTHYPAMEANKANWSRFWLVAFAQSGLEWSSDHWTGYYQGLGHYSQEAAALIDSVISLAQYHNIYLQMVLQQHGQYSENVNPTWDENPYNVVNGGYLNRAHEFFADSLAKEQTKKMYRYIVARWGYSPNVMAWELFNEANFAGSNDNPESHDVNVDTWHDEMSQYLKSIDAFDHLVTTSSDAEQLILMDDNESMDLLQYHLYQDPVAESLQSRAEYMRSVLTKPVMNGEFGSNNSNDPYRDGLHPDQWGDHIRKAMWTGLFYDVPNMFWFWDSYIESKGLFQIFRPFGDYLEGEDFAVMTDLSSEVPELSGSPVHQIIRKAIPGGDWGTVPETQDFKVQEDGATPGIAQFPRYLQGAFHPELGTWVEFEVEFKSDGLASIEVADVAEAPNNIEILVDDNLELSQEMGANSSISVDVPAGNHKVRFSNTGQDWVNVKSYSFSGGGDESVLKSYSKRSSDRAYGYLYDARYGDWADEADVDPILGLSLEYRDFQSGIYQVDYYDPIEGGTLSTEYVSSFDSLLSVPAPVFKKDLALKLKYYGQGVQPVADAGEDQEILIGPSVMLDGTNSFSPEDRSLTYAWKLAYRPDGSQSTLSTDTLDQLEFIPDVTGTYLINLIVDDGELKSTSDRVNITVISPITGVDEPRMQPDLRLYPNPTSSDLNIIAGEGHQILSYGIINSTGQLVVEEFLDNQPGQEIRIGLSVMNLQPGVYILKLVTSESVVTKRFIFGM